MAGYNPIFTDEEQQNEIWKPIVGFEDYYSVSSLGRIRRDSNEDKGKAGHVLQPRKSTKTCYAQIKLRVKGKPFYRLVHRLVALSFIENPSPCELIEVNHKDWDKSNNRSSNLEWATRLSNAQHAARNGLYSTGENHYLHKHPELHPRGTNHPISKLTDEKVREIRLENKLGKSLSILAIEHGVTKSAIWSVVKFKTWRHVTQTS